MKTFFLCSIGPVQDFIATARKSRDLWYGSWLLSELSKVVAKHISDNYRFEDLIFPSPDDQNLLGRDQDFNVPNKIMATLDQFDPAKATEILVAMDEFLENLWVEARKKVGGPLDTEELAKAQITDIVEFYWAAVPYENENDYPIAREKAEALLASRKNTRNFKQHVGSNKPKSSLDGFRESVIPRNAYPTQSDPPEERIAKINALFHKYHAGEAEQLSGVDLLKRLGEIQKSLKFPSTSDLAADSFLERINKGDVTKSNENKILKDIKENILFPHGWSDSDIGEDRSLVFESRLAEFLPAKEDREKARNKLSEILKPFVGELRPNPYYALIIADGDNMGKLIDSMKTPDEHRNLSKKISALALDVPGIFKDHNGACIYAGGEDILGYLPLQNALACAEVLHQKFEDAMTGYSFEDIDGKQKSPTLSGGIVIGHHLTPLSDIFTLARKAEKEAKRVRDKNSLAIILNKRSGSEKMIIGKWSELIMRLEIMTELFRKDWISTGTAYELQNLAFDLEGIGIQEEEVALSDEAMRIIKRKRQSGSDEKLTSKVLCQFESWLISDKFPINQVAQEMIIAKEFASSEDLANKPIKEVLKCRNG